MGPLRLLRALARTRQHVRLRAVHPSVTVEIELEDAFVIGGEARGAAGEMAHGHAALATLLALPSARVLCEPWSGSRLMDVVAPLPA